MKRLYSILALAAIAHLGVLAGLVGFLFGTGRLNPDRIEQIAAVIRGERDEDATTTAPATPPTPVVRELATAEMIRQQQELEEIRRRRLQQQVQRARQATELATLARIDVIRRSESLDRRQKAFDAQRQALAQQANTTGFQKVLKLIGSLTPQIGKKMLIKKSDAQAVQLLAALSDRKASAILGACRTEEELAWADTMLSQMAKTNESVAEPPAGFPRTETPN